MKKIKTISLASFLLIVMSTIIIISCSKERVQQQPTLNTYNSPNTYLDSKKQTEQEFDIDSTGSGPIVGNQGTKIWIGKQCLMFPNGDSVVYPFKIKLVELYTPKDMIYYQMPTVASGNILETDGEIRLRAFKNGIELVLKPNPCYSQIEMPNAAPKNYMKVHYGFNNTNWTDNPASLGVTSSLNPIFSQTSYGYLAQIAKLGWINCGVNAASSPSSALTFTSSVDDLTNLAIFVYIPGKKTVMQVPASLVSDQIPNGTNVKIVIIGVDGSGTLFSYDQQLTVNSNTQIDVTMASTTDAALTTLLNNL